MLTYLFDASAAVEIYLPRSERASKIVRHVLEQKATYHQATLFIPNFCVAEVLNCLARKHFDPPQSEAAISREQYESCLRKFREHVHWGKTLYPYDLNRYHVIAADLIVPAEHSIQRRYSHDHLSTFDILIITMACELAYTSRRDDTYLMTCDKRLKLVCKGLKQTDFSKLAVTGPLGELESRRWQVPNCLYLPELQRAELPRVPGQSQL